MMTLQAKSTKESLVIGTPSDAPKSVRSDIIYLEINAAKPFPIPNTTSIDDLLKEFEADAEMASAMATARKTIANTLYSDNAVTFSAIRLAAGLSQDQLAQKSMTSQSHIARIEAGKTD